MRAETNISLREFNTFGLDVLAKSFLNITSEDELTEALRRYNSEDVFILGGGSNMLLRSNIDRPVLHINLKGVDVVKQDHEWVWVKAMAGENWHEFVLWCIEQGYGGLENLSLIPGNVGSAPIQNIGAYGVELKDTFDYCEAVNIKSAARQQFNLGDCDFGYRESVFKTTLKGLYVITSVVFKLRKKDHKLKTSYGAIQQELHSRGIVQPTIKDVSEAVIAIRQSKLPDPKDIGNSGSFFKNPVISISHFNKLKTQFKEIPSYPVSESLIKVPAGWLIETAGFKGKRMGNYGVHEKQALVLVNYGGASGEDIYALAQLIKDTIRRLFNIDLEIEVNII